MRWSTCTLGELTASTRPICYGVLKPGEFIDDGIPLVRVTDISQNHFDSSNLYKISASLDEEFARSRLEGGEILLSIQGTVGRVAIVPQEMKGANISRTIAIISPDDRVHRPYLYHYLRRLGNTSGFYTSGSTRASLNISELRDATIPLPPLEEQRRIAAILDKASAIRRCSEKAARNAADIKASLFDEAFIAHDRHGHWEQIALGELCDVQGGLQVTSARSAMPIRVPYLRVANVLRGRLDLAEIKEINCSQPELGRTRLQHKDLLVVEGHGNPNEIGRVAMWTEQTGEMVHQNHLIRVRSKSSSLDPEFLCFYLNSRMGRRHLLKRANTTSGLNTISTSVVKSAPIIVPPICEQRSFCETIRYIAQLEASLLVGSALHAQLSRSLLSESFDK
jgi:type I restriction enzyme S subunit